ncbi:hypothetical protein B0H14DRAFT_3509699 [Mycena olivaceomarginata]|nr:hypothetical protein B0H14DRAFT_3509699 [Mycena olivaceomarginata]
MSSSSFATVTALTVLENPRKASPRTTVFTSHLFLGVPGLEKILGSVRYYSEDDGEYPEVGVYQATMAIAKMEKGVNVFTEDAKEQAEFSFFYLIGDLDSPAVANIDLARRPYMNICGAVTRSDSTAATFTLDADQYTSAFAEQQKSAATDNNVVAQKSVFPALGFIPDSPRYKSKKPVPWVKKYVAFGSYLTGISASLEGETLQERFRIEVDSIAFLGTYTHLAGTPAGSSSAGAGTASAGASGSRKKARFSYNPKPTKRAREDEGPDSGAPSSPSPFASTSTSTTTAT